ncbi:MAG: TldD/PmbA family protein [Deltaproteobacteria bacterium]|nr:MAG: TldD/PmbA family protein [Deltaproteobacteria bacterium]
MSGDLTRLAEQTIERAGKAGAQQSAALISRRRFIDLQYRDGKLEKITESKTSSLSLDLYVDGRFSSHSSSDLRPQILKPFVARAVAMTRLLGADKHRGLADPALYDNRPTTDIQIYDPAYEQVTTDRRKAIASAIERTARAQEGPIISVTSGYYDALGESAQVHSNGFSGYRRATQFWMGGEVSVKDEGGRRPEDWYWVGGRFLSELPGAKVIGREAANRALARLGQVKLDSGHMTVVVENRASRSLMRHFMKAMSGSSLQQQRSFLTDKLGKRVGSSAFHLVDEPLLPRALGSRHYDSDGISAKKRTLVDRGKLTSYLIDVYYGRKLGAAPTTNGTSNLVMGLGKRSKEAIIKSVKKGVFISGFLGGNSDSTVGDFSHGIVGFEIRDGKLGRPIGEMNITGNHLSLWTKLVEVGNDPYLYSTMHIPTLVFEALSVSGK